MIIEELRKTKKELEEIAGAWNGDESGELEDRAHEANECIGLVDKLITKLESLGF